MCPPPTPTLAAALPQCATKHQKYCCVLYSQATTPTTTILQQRQKSSRKKNKKGKIGRDGRRSLYLGCII